MLLVSHVLIMQTPSDSLKRDQAPDLPGSEDTSGKKRRTSSASKALFLRNLADDVTPDEFLVYFQQFGIATRLHIKQKGQAFVQLANEAQAMSCMQYYVQNPIMIRGRAHNVLKKITELVFRTYRARLEVLIGRQCADSKITDR
jgi:RNA recognition motif-containing protein